MSAGMKWLNQARWGTIAGCASWLDWAELGLAGRLAVLAGLNLTGLARPDCIPMFFLLYVIESTACYWDPDVFSLSVLCILGARMLVRILARSKAFFFFHLAWLPLDTACIWYTRVHKSCYQTKTLTFHIYILWQGDNLWIPYQSGIVKSEIMG